MRFSKKSEYALRALIELTDQYNRKLLQRHEIGRKQNIPIEFLEQILLTLKNAGLLSSRRGVGGGYRFAGNARRLTLMDVIRLFEELGTPDGDRREPGEATPVGQALASVLFEIDEIAKATMSSITLATMLRLVGRQQRNSGPGPGATRPVAPSAPQRRRRKS